LIIVILEKENDEVSRCATFPSVLLLPLIWCRHSPWLLFSNILSLRSLLNAKAQVLHRRKTTGRIIILYSLFFTFLDIGKGGKKFWTEW
jgi:hypothetical protein